jgi:BirA family transcriptional regulator, biotin operon repressor / biotin---[acetyl-CoA-carboxylase] ligase
LHKLFKHTGLIGKKALFLPACHSTNEIAARLVAEQKAEHGHVVYTDFQTKGRGQRGNSWESENGKNLLLSVVLDASFIDPENVYNLTLLTSLAIHDTLSEYIPEGLKIKWPNDIYYYNRKIAGILIENFLRQSVIQWSIAGMGININQEIFHEKYAISLAQICRQQFDREEIIQLLIQNIENRYKELKQGQSERLRSAYLSKLYWKDEIHVFQSDGKFFNGRIESVEYSGKLKIALEQGHRLFDLKEVVFVK